MIARVSGGDVLILHLGMSGRFTIGKVGAGDEARPGQFAHVTENVIASTITSMFEMSGLDRHGKQAKALAGSAGASRIVYNDPRRFGFMLMIGEEEFDTHR